MKIHSDPLLNLVRADRGAFIRDEELLVRRECLALIGGRSVHNSGRVVAYERMRCRMFGSLLHLIPLDVQVSDQNNNSSNHSANTIVHGAHDDQHNILDYCMVLALKHCTAKVVAVSDSLEFLLDFHYTDDRYYFLCESLEQRDAWKSSLDKCGLYRELVTQNIVRLSILESSTTNNGAQESVQRPHLATQSSHSLTFECDNLSNIASAILPFFWLRVSYRDHSHATHWTHLGNTEPIRSRSPQFRTAITLPDFGSQATIEFKIEVLHSFDSVPSYSTLVTHAHVSLTSLRVHSRIPLTKMSNRSSIHIHKREISPSQNCPNFAEHILTHDHSFSDSRVPFIIEESCIPAPNVFVTPLKFLSHHIVQNRQIIECLVELSLPDISPELIHFHEDYDIYLDDMKKAVESHSKKIHFRSSVLKEDEFIQSVPLNLQLQCTRAGDHIQRTFTSGAIAFHQNLSSKTLINIAQLYDIHRKLCDVLSTKDFLCSFLSNNRLDPEEITPESDRYRSEVTVNVRPFYEYIVFMCQILLNERVTTQEVSDSFKIVNLNLDGHKHNPIANMREQNIEDVFEPVDLIYLNIQACIVKTNEILAKNSPILYSDISALNHKLQTAIESLKKTISLVYLTWSSIRFVARDYKVQLYREQCLLSQAVTAIQFLVSEYFAHSPTAIETVHRTKYVPISYEALLTCFEKEELMMKDMLHALDTAERRVVFHFRKNIPYPSVQFSGTKIILNHIIPDSVVGLDDFVAKLFVVVFNIGINAEEKVAHLLGANKFQYESNARNWSKLKSFIELFHRENETIIKLIPRIDSHIAQHISQDLVLLVFLKACAAEISAIPLTCCKSGKDRTAMSVTYEHARELCRRYRLKDPQIFNLILHSLRRNGVRLQNVAQNVGAPRYAFSKLQRFGMPEVMRPPGDCCSGLSKT